MCIVCEIKALIGEGEAMEKVNELADNLVASMRIHRAVRDSLKLAKRDGYYTPEQRAALQGIEEFINPGNGVNVVPIVLQEGEDLMQAIARTLAEKGIKLEEPAIVEEPFKPSSGVTFH